MFNFSSTKNLAIDLGNNNTLLSDQSTILLSQPSFMIVNELNNNVEAVGDEAYKMLEKTHSNLKPVKPLKGGVISDGESVKKMLKNLGPEPTPAICPYCEQKIITKTSIKLPNSTKLFVCLMCLVITLAPLALVVYKESVSSPKSEAGYDFLTIVDEFVYKILSRLRLLVCSILLSKEIFFVHFIGQNCET
mgnify:CR=1 FL=1